MRKLVAAVLLTLACSIPVTRPRAPSLDAEPIAPTPPPAAILEERSVSPYSDGVWLAGYWRWDDTRYVWIGGRWDHARSGMTWDPTHWVRVTRGWRLVWGGWRPAL